MTTLDRTTPFTVYNFTVAGTHNYYAATLDTLVHNCEDVALGIRECGLKHFAQTNAR
ncbi:hypothetical protein ACFQ3B_01340 [Stackebrandtia endophytica]|uniref:hypothetical protein n=1 Tax=Stackebrandtia endophytica TaxID=1496996 RepID=UPI0014774106